MKNIRIFYLKTFIFFGGEIYLNRRLFVVISSHKTEYASAHAYCHIHLVGERNNLSNANYVKLQMTN